MSPNRSSLSPGWHEKSCRVLSAPAWEGAVLWASVFPGFSLRNHRDGWVSDWPSGLARLATGLRDVPSWHAASPSLWREVAWHWVNGHVTSSDTLGSAPLSTFCALTFYSLSWLLVSKLWNQMCLLAVSDLVVLNSGEFNSDSWTPTSPIPRACVLQWFLSHREIILFLSFLSWFRKTGLFERFIMTLGTYRLLFRRVLFSKEC